MRLGYSTNSISDIDPIEALPALEEMGYRSLAITLDHGLLNPYGSSLPADVERWRTALATCGMASVLETGARHLLDPRLKHEPTLVSAAAEERMRRVDFLRRAIDVAAELGATCVSLWSGLVRDSADEETLWRRLAGGLAPVLDHARSRGIRLGFEPEPGMFIDTIARYRLLCERLAGGPVPDLTVDLGHMECMGEWPFRDHLHAVAGRIVNVHLDDMLACRHEHLPLGQGDVDLAAMLRLLAEAGYQGGIHVELPRQSHAWRTTAVESAGIFGRARGQIA